MTHTARSKPCKTLPGLSEAKLPASFCLPDLGRGQQPYAKSKAQGCDRIESIQGGLGFMVLQW